MKIIAVDDEKLVLEDLVEQLVSLPYVSKVKGFTKPAEALKYIEENNIDAAFVDINMRGMDGLALATEINRISPTAAVIFLTGYSEYAGDAFKLRASGYLLKPASIEDIEAELANLRLSVAKDRGCRLRVQTFCNFEVFSGDRPVHFKRAKSKELFAYLIDRRGAGATMAEIAAILWECKNYDRSLFNQIHTFISDLIAALRAEGADDVIIKGRNNVAVNPEMIDCDYYRFLRGEVAAVNSFTGEYMKNYSWAEFTVGYLTKVSGRGRNKV